MSDSEDLVRQQFGRHANAYATSAVHAQGESLARLTSLTQPQRDWIVLDVSTGAGHTALAFAPSGPQPPIWSFRNVERPTCDGGSAGSSR